MALKYGFIIFVGNMEQLSTFHTYIFLIYKEDDLNKTGIFIKVGKHVDAQPRRTLASFYPKMKGVNDFDKKRSTNT